ncbi:hypothetical protein [Aureispira anguillae]|uniref:Uncharacterized protein n=1 Tax=Aureispira anguillae TaxID=2864201 RepID=A0A915YF61_9BACT|nr:hypothetical protein [Aureispira anguillae]BDS12005.1 hypothetical protein AsAng_0027200 [Aureispira anguillae]
MKVILGLLMLIVCYFTVTLQAQSAKPEKVHSIVKIYKGYEWYSEQHELWKKELAQHPNNPAGWLNYYTATRMAKIGAPSSDIRNTWFEKMGQVVEEMKAAIQGTYEYYYIQAYHDMDDEGINHALKAYEMDPNRPDVYDELMTHYELTRNKTKLKEIAKKWLASGDFSPTVLIWNYNMLNSTEKNAILITMGDNDTYPSLVLQYAEGIREDVVVLNKSLALKEDYRNALFKELGIPALNGEINDYKEIVNYVIEHKGTHPLYFALGGNPAKLGMQDKLFNVGLAMLYCEDGANSTSLLIKNFEQNIMLDHLKCSIYKEEFPSEIQRYNVLYIPSLLMLYKHYLLTNDLNKQAELRTLILKIGTDYDQRERILEVLADYESKTK